MSSSYAVIYGHVVRLQLNWIQLTWIGGLTGGGNGGILEGDRYVRNVAQPQLSVI